jgi:hypothetical protein
MNIYHFLAAFFVSFLLSFLLFYYSGISGGGGNTNLYFPT